MSCRIHVHPWYYYASPLEYGLCMRVRKEARSVPCSHACTSRCAYVDWYMPCVNGGDRTLVSVQFQHHDARVWKDVLLGRLFEHCPCKAFPPLGGFWCWPGLKEFGPVRVVSNVFWHLPMFLEFHLLPDTRLPRRRIQRATSKTLRD